MTLDNEGAIKLIRFLYDIKKRPQLFLEQKSYTQLYYAILGFITGYFYASGYSAIEYLNNMGNDNIWNNFCDFYYNKYHITINATSKIVGFFENEESAFDIFFIELSNFLKENGIDEPHVD